MGKGTGERGSKYDGTQRRQKQDYSIFTIVGRCREEGIEIVSSGKRGGVGGSGQPEGWIEDLGLFEGDIWEKRE